MPVVFVCSRCHKPIKIFWGGTSSGLPTLESIFNYYECPHCHSRLIPDPDMVEVAVYPWRPNSLKKLVEKIKKGELSEEEKEKLMRKEEGRALLEKYYITIEEVLKDYERKERVKKVQEMIKEAKRKKGK